MAEALDVGARYVRFCRTVPSQPAPEVRGEAHLIALACSPAPEGHDHWTLRLLAGKVVELGPSSMSHEGVVCPQAVAEEGVVHSQGRNLWHMEDVLDL